MRVEVAAHGRQVCFTIEWQKESTCDSAASKSVREENAPVSRRWGFPHVPNIQLSSSAV